MIGAAAYMSMLTNCLISFYIKLFVSNYDSFYQYKTNVGKECCIEICDMKNNQECFNPVNSYCHQFVGKFLLV